MWRFFFRTKQVNEVKRGSEDTQKAICCGEGDYMAKRSGNRVGSSFKSKNRQAEAVLRTENGTPKMPCLLFQDSNREIQLIMTCFVTATLGLANRKEQHGPKSIMG